MSKKIRVGIIYGGPSAERDISFITGKAVCENLNPGKYDILPLEMSKEKKFFLVVIKIIIVWILIIVVLK